MKFAKRNLMSCCLAFSLFLAVGCEKKTGEGTPPPSAPGAQTQPQAPAQVQAQAPAVEVAKPVADVQAQAKTMSVEDLKAAALKYKEAILAKQAELEKVVAKVKEIPITEALGQEAKTLKTDLSNIEASLKAMKDRYQVYYDTLKEKGGDLTGLTP